MQVIPVQSIGSQAGTGEFGEMYTEGYQAAGRVVLVIEKGPHWIADQDGQRVDVAAPSVVIYDTGDWVQYGRPSGFAEVRLFEYSGPAETAEGWHPCRGPDGVDPAAYSNQPGLLKRDPNDPN